MTISRRTLAGAGLAGLAAAGIGGAATAAPIETKPFSLTAKRRQITLPNLPTLGVTYIATLDLFDKAGSPVGEAAAGNSVVDVTLEGPVVLANVVLKLTDGEIHYQRLMKRFGDYPRESIGAITGGTGAYHDIRGEVGISWLDADRIELDIRPAS